MYKANNNNNRLLKSNPHQQCFARMFSIASVDCNLTPGIEWVGVYRRACVWIPWRRGSLSPCFSLPE